MNNIDVQRLKPVNTSIKLIGPFFTTHGNMTKQVRLFSYIKSKEYHHHHDEVFTSKCDRVRQLFILSSALLGVTLLSAFIV